MFDIRANNFFLLFSIMFYVYLNASKYDNILFSFTFLPVLNITLFFT